MSIPRDTPQAVVSAALSAVLLTACASTVPEAIRTAPPEAPSVEATRGSPERFIGARVRWGGLIAALDNRRSETWIEIVSKTLQRGGRPSDSDASEGRFLARISGFLDPAIYTPEREITVVGQVAGAVTRPIGEYAYRFPLVDAEAHYLWAPLPPPYYGDPFWLYDPWYPFGCPWHARPYCW